MEDVKDDLLAAIAGDPQFNLEERIEQLERIIKVADGVVDEELVSKAKATSESWQAIVAEAKKFLEKDDEAKKAAAVALAEMRSPEALPYLKKAMKTQSNPFVGHKILEAMGRIGHKSVIPDLERMSRNATKIRDRETASHADVAVLEIKRDVAALEQELQNKRIKPFQKVAIEAALVRLRRDEAEERERETELLPS
jgi:HEAT repeat protein